MTSNDDRCGGQARNWDWAVKIAGRVAVCLVGVALVAAGGIGLALGR